MTDRFGEAYEFTQTFYEDIIPVDHAFVIPNDSIVEQAYFIQHCDFFLLFVPIISRTSLEICLLSVQDSSLLLPHFLGNDASVPLGYFYLPAFQLSPAEVCFGVSICGDLVGRSLSGLQQLFKGRLTIGQLWGPVPG